MAIHRITPAHDDSIQVEFELPIKGRQNPLFFTVPRVDYLPLEIAEEYKAWFKDHDGDDRAATLKLLELAAPKHYSILAKLTTGELTQISKVWGEQSSITPGESSASSDS